MKKLLTSLCLLLAVLITAFGGTVSALVYANTPYEQECDRVFFEALDQVLQDNAVAQENIAISKEAIYDLNLDQLGYVYSIDLVSGEGYAIIVNTSGIFEVTEIFLDAQNPYGDAAGQKIYAGIMLYFVFTESNFAEPESGLMLDPESLDALSAIALYSAGDVFSTGQETIYYTSRTTDTYEMAYRHPAYVGTVVNGCVPTAGANIVGYFTRFYPELMPGFTPGNPLGNAYLYRETAIEAINLIQTLAIYMNTNVGSPGTTISGFKSGLISFMSQKGHTISFVSCMSGSAFSYNTAKQRMQEGKPLVLFVDTFTVASLANRENNEEVNYFLVNAPHAMAGFGAIEITYKLTSGATRIDRYIMVATGIADRPKGYFNINYQTQIDEVYAISVG